MHCLMCRQLLTQLIWYLDQRVYTLVCPVPASASVYECVRSYVQPMDQRVYTLVYPAPGSTGVFTPVCLAPIS